ncbi:hypothetical protein niasHT_019908 [Heterodera trifolii]|uniref:Uncharacterized protein n=1 Tax=Heterodera trifolii TaxID=157864 RepID=A0ABD2L3T5_9BILA
MAKGRDGQTKRRRKGGREKQQPNWENGCHFASSHTNEWCRKARGHLMDGKMANSLEAPSFPTELQGNSFIHHQSEHFGTAIVVNLATQNQSKNATAFLALSAKIMLIIALIVRSKIEQKVQQTEANDVKRQYERE